MGKYRKRFNEKARSGMLSKQAALKNARNKQFTRHTEEETPQTPAQDVQEDPNAAILKPMSEQEKNDRKRHLEETLYSQNEKQAKLTKAKKKRLDKYIEHQIKREEKKTLLEKLSKTKMDTNLLAPSKLLGTGKQTRREEMVEALQLEKQGRGDERTKLILYEEREVKDWRDADQNEFANYKQISSEDDDDEEDVSKFGDDGFPSSESKSSFVDNRPAKFGGSGFGFGFANLPKAEKIKLAPKKKYSWRLAVEKQEKKQNHMDDEDDFNSTEESGSEGASDSDEESSEEDGDEDEDEDEDGEVQSLKGKNVTSSSNDQEEAELLENGEDDDGEQIEDEITENENQGEDDDEDEDNEDEDNEDEQEDSESESESESDDEDLPRLLQNKAKHSRNAETFKDWAEQQLRQLEGRDTEMVLPELLKELKDKYSQRTVREEDELSDHEPIPINKNLQRDAFYVNVTRPSEIQELRLQLPVFGEEHRIMEAVHHHDCLIICGETGSGKTTQVPQFLYESGFGNLKSDMYPGMIGVTQPRRVAAISMAERVGKELGDHEKRVGYQIRFDTTIKNEGKEDGTAVKFMTDGVLLREMMTDLMLTKYSAVIIDEAHERNINTDILIGMLSRVLKLRREYHTKDPKKYKPLKLIVMSATLRVSDFSENKQLFKTPPPILKVDARQYPVSVHFDKRTKFDYLEEAFKKTCKIHRKLPPGGILIFLTGQNEITSMVKKLRAEFPTRRNTYAEEGVTTRVSKNVAAEVEDFDFEVDVKVQDLEENDDYESDDEEEEGFEETLEAGQSESDPLYVLPLYSLLPSKEQLKVFQPPPPGSRMCIVATNVAETSLTIPGIRYVVDCGRSKERKFNEETGVQSFEVDWVSKASAGQRAGRAGRTGPGHCYRLFSSAIYEDYFDEFSRPEILRMPVESTVLAMKSMGIDQIVNFPFPTPPERLSLSKAERLLIILGALEKETKAITDLGRTMSLFPLNPRFAKILIIGNQLECLPYVVAIVSALTVGEPFISEHELGIGAVQKDDDEEEDTESQADLEKRRSLRTKFNQSRAMFSKLDAASDVFRLLSAVCAYDHVSPAQQPSFLRDNFLRAKVMEEIRKLRKQLAYIVKVNTSKESIGYEAPADEQMKLGIPSKKQLGALKQMVASGFVDQTAIRGDLASSDIDLPNKTSITNVPYMSLFPSSTKDDEVEPYVYVHPNSVMAGMGQIPPSYVVYQSLNLGSNRKEGKLSKLRMKPLVDISGKQLANVAKGALITYSKPLGHPYAPKNISPTKRECYVVPRFGAAIGLGGVGWDLPAIKAVQVKKNGLWVVEA